MTEKNIIVEYFKCCEVEVVRSFYGGTAYRNKESVKEDDEIVAAFLDKMVGVFRLCAENGVCVLRGFNVLTYYQRNGIGTRMLKQFESELRDRVCYLICKNSLNSFYEQVGFEICKENVPIFLADRMESYKNETLNILVRYKN